MVINAKTLSKELFDYQINAMKGGLADIHGVGEIIAKEAVKCETPLINFVGSLGGKACFDIYHYWKYRDEIQDYQIKNNISSVAFQEVNWEGNIIRYPEIEDQLMPMPQDKAIVMRYKDKVVDWFLKFAEKKMASGYELIKKDDDGYSDQDIVVTTEDVLKYAVGFEWAGVTQYNPKPHPVYMMETDENGNHIDKGIGYWFREFLLFLYKGNPSDTNDYDDLVVFSINKTWENEPTIFEL